MRIGTISLNINAPDFNYGAVLHSWAFQQYLKKLDYVSYTEIINYLTPCLRKQNIAFPAFASLMGLHLRVFIQNIIEMPKYRKRYKKFKQFEDKYMNISKIGYTQESLEKAKLNYDVIICESDVIWSPGFFGGKFDKSFFLALDSMKEMKRIAYAPSMSDGDLSDKQKRELCELLEYLDYISCRESYEKKILEKCTNKTVTHVLDPVMLIDAEDYDEITGERIIDKHYLLLYLPMDDNISLRKQASVYASKNNLQIMEINTKLKTSISGVDICFGTAGIQEFLSAIKYADVVFTNSFHAICFSIIFHVEFYAFSRTNAGKVKDICDTLKLKDRFFEDNVFRESNFIDYNSVMEELKKMRNISKNWIDKALRGY